MGIRDPRIDAYIDAAAGFARPILQCLRAAVHDAAPDATEAIKWSMPFFVCNGTNLCSMAAFREHCSFGLWRGRELLGDAAEAGAMGQFGRLRSLDDLPPPGRLRTLIHSAVVLQSAPRPRPARAVRPSLPVPDDLRAALQQQPAAWRQFEAFTPGKQRDYSEWIADARRPDTRIKRIAQAVEWIAEGKARHWKYERG